jgi:hypothetical protein
MKGFRPLFKSNPGIGLKEYDAWAERLSRGLFNGRLESGIIVSRIFRVFEEKLPQVFGTPNVGDGPPLFNE